MLSSVFQKTTLDNGLRIVTVPMRQVRSVTVLIMVGAGSRYETRKTNGLSHFMEHMLFKGTQKRPTAFDIFSVIDSVGGEYNGATAKDYMEFYIKVASSHLNLALDVLTDTLLNSKFASQEIEREKGVIVEEINLREDTPLIRIADLFERLLYHDNPLGWDTAGKKEVIKKFKRSDFLSYLKNFFVANNMVVTVTGGFKEKDILEMASSCFGSLPKSRLPKWKEVQEQQKSPEVLLKHKKTDQAHLCLGVRAYPLEHKNRYTTAILNAILGKTASSRLNIEVRDKRGLAYYIRSGKQAYKDVGYWVTQAGIDISRIEEAIRIILKEFKRIKDKKLKEEELQKAKEHLKGRLILSLEDSKAVAGFYGEQELLENKIKTPKEIITCLDKVTVKEIQRVAQRIFVPEKLNLAVVGPYKDQDRFKNLLQWL
jgi:predicted Zn-dependent peptidase